MHLLKRAPCKNYVILSYMTREERLQRVAGMRQSGIIVILEDIHDPHNASAIMRTCDALGVQDVGLVFQGIKSWNPKRIGKSSSSSANKWLSFRTFSTTEECIASLKNEGYVSIGTVIDGDKDLSEVKFAAMPQIALWIGNEHSGLSMAARNAASMTLRIPMKGFVESLNVSVAAALVLYEITRQRHKQYTKADALALAKKWLTS